MKTAEKTPPAFKQTSCNCKIVMTTAICFGPALCWDPGQAQVGFGPQWACPGVPPKGFSHWGAGRTRGVLLPDSHAGLGSPHWWKQLAA